MMLVSRISMSIIKMNLFGKRGYDKYQVARGTDMIAKSEYYLTEKVYITENNSDQISQFWVTHRRQPNMWSGARDPPTPQAFMSL